MSSGRPMRPSGDDFAIESPKLRSVSAIIFDSNGPGAIAFTVMCLRPSCAARWRVSWWIAALLDEYAYVSMIGTWMPSIDPMLMTRAGSSAVAAASSSGRSARVRKNGALTLSRVHLVPGAVGVLGERRAPVRARVVHEDVQRARCPRRPAPASAMHVGFGREVGRDADARADLAQLGRHLVAHLGLAGRDVDLGARPPRSRGRS